jgi:hypothetical protein
MDLSAINFIFRFGNIFSLTPHSTRLKRNLPRHLKIRSAFVFTLLTIFVCCILSVRRVHFGRLSLTQLSMIVLSIATECLYNAYIFIIVKIYKHIKWAKLLKYLQQTHCHNNKIKTYYLQFVTSQLVVLSILIAEICIALLIFEGSVILPIIWIWISTYLQIFDATLRCIILQMVLSRYQYQNFVFKRASSHKLDYYSLLKILRGTKKNMFILKNAVEIYNDMFGWTTLFNIFVASFRTLFNIDILLRRDGTFRLANGSGNTFNVIFHLTVIFIGWVNHLVFYLAQFFNFIF